MLVKTFAGTLDVCEDDAWIRNHTRFGNIFEEHIILGPLAPILKRSQVVLDIGANNGNHTLAYSFITPDSCAIHSFEPQSRLFSKLQNTVSLNDHAQKKVTCYNVALGDECKKCSMEPIENRRNHEYNVISLGSVSLGEGGEEVQMITLDSLKLRDCDFIKMDVEGAESMVLRGAKRTIDAFHPIIMFEHNQENLTPDINPFRILTEVHGYKTFQYLDWCNWLTWHPLNPPDLPIQPCLKPLFH